MLNTQIIMQDVNGNEFQIPLITLITLTRGLKLEIETGMQLTGGQTCARKLGDLFGIKRMTAKRKQEMLDYLQKVKKEIDENLGVAA